jgi:hypothetical protein
MFIKMSHKETVSGMKSQHLKIGVWLLILGVRGEERVEKR